MHMYELVTPLRRVPAGRTIPLSWDDGEALVRLGAAIRVEAETIAAGATDAERDERRQELLRQLADVAGIPDKLMVVVAPASAGMYLMTVGDAGVTDIQSYNPATDPLASGDPAVIRRHHLDALRDLDDLTYLAFDDSAAADLGGLVLLSMDAETGIVTGVVARSAEPVGFDVARSIVADAVQMPGTTDADSAALSPSESTSGGQEAEVAAIEPATDEALARMTKDQLLGEARRVGAAIDGSPTKAELLAAIVAKRVAA